MQLWHKVRSASALLGQPVAGQTAHEVLYVPSLVLFHEKVLLDVITREAQIGSV